VVPTEFLAEATIPETHRAALIAWLRSLTGRSPSVRFNWGRPDPLTLTCEDNGIDSVTIQVPVTIQGIPPVIAFDPRFLASALEIGPTLRFIDGMSPLLASGPGGVYCVIMPQRFDAAIVAAQREETATASDRCFLAGTTRCPRVGEQRRHRGLLKMCPAPNICP
jgi:hypothetical protein